MTLIEPKFGPMGPDQTPQKVQIGVFPKLLA